MMELRVEQVQSLFARLYGKKQSERERQLARYTTILKCHEHFFPSADVQLFSTPGRTELGGNHTDHNGGIVLAGSVYLDSIAAVSRTNTQIITVHSEGFPDPFVVDCRDLGIKKREMGTTAALIRGIAARFKELGYSIGGFNACIASNVGIGSGLSSSASIEVLLATIENALYNKGRVPLLEIAQIGQHAENAYFGKPCGLMDQIACAIGGIITIDFKNFHQPAVRKIPFDFSDFHYSLLVVETGSSHADLTKDYADIPREMKLISRELGAETCRELTLNDLIKNFSRLRANISDRALLRAYHFITENERVKEQVAALERRDLGKFLELVMASGHSSAKWLQNSFSTEFPLRQGVSLALAVTEHFFKEKKGGGYRVHGGGFAGTIQVFIPDEYLDEYIRLVENTIGKNSVTSLKIRPYGSIHLNPLFKGT